MGKSYNPRDPPDGDADRDLDYYQNVVNGYRDSDDAAIDNAGRAPDVAERKALTAFAKRYFAAAADADGATACIMIQATFAGAIPEAYGQGGAAYLRGAATCAAVMTRLFEHLHGELAARVAVTGVRVMGRRAFVIIGSPTLQASYLTLQRENGAWKTLGLIGTPLP